MLGKKTKVRTELKMEWKRLSEGRSTLKSEELFRDDKTISALKKKKGISQLAGVNLKIYEIDKEIEAIYKEKNKEFIEKFGNKAYYYQIEAGDFFIELGLLILMGGLVYTTLIGITAIRVSLRRKREIGTNRIKRRKTGVIFILVGIGIAFVFFQLSDRAGDVIIDIGDLWLEFPYGYPYYCWNHSYSYRYWNGNIFFFSRRYKSKEIIKERLLKKLQANESKTWVYRVKKVVKRI